MPCHNRHQLLKSVIQGGDCCSQLKLCRDNMSDWKYLECVGRGCSEIWLGLWRTVRYVWSKGVCAHAHVLGATSCVSSASQLLCSNHYDSMPRPLMIRQGKSSEGKQNKLHSHHLPTSKVKRIKILSCQSEAKFPQKLTKVCQTGSRLGWKEGFRTVLFCFTKIVIW